MEHTVVRKTTGEPVTKGSKQACIDFIRDFDRQSPTYLDLRLLDAGGSEIDYHAVPTTVQPSIPMLSTAVQAYTEEQTLVILRRLLHLDGRSVIANGTYFYPTLQPLSFASIERTRKTLELDNWVVSQSARFKADDRQGWTLVLVHPDESRKFNILIMTTEMQCIALTSASPSVFDL